MDDFPDHDADSNFVAALHKKLVEFLGNSADMKKTVKSSFKQSLYAAGGALAGGMVLGPPGGLVGGIVGSIVGFMKAEDYDGAVVALSKLDGQPREALVKNVWQILSQAGATDFASVDRFQQALSEYCTQKRVREEVWDACADALS
mmetsp:Transcript_27776/g.77828  ORF Transcript_27776/g.77828 Transcript_27776/m.77828 type:complete len:146 (+) Transcript_27776:1029-1466(+)